LRSAMKSVLGLAGLHRPPRDLQAKRHTPPQIRRLFEQSGLQEIQSKCVGFGPFTLFGRHVIPERLGIALHTHLQFLADRRIPPFHLTGSHYLARAEK
jgi:hypothetical protein